MKTLFINISLTLSLVIISPFSLQSQALQKLNPKNWNKKEIVEEKSFEQLKDKAIGGKEGERIKNYMLKEAQSLKKIEGSIISIIRNGEIIKVSIPASKLFDPNDTILFSNVENIFSPFVKETRDSLIDIVITSHYDNTGTPLFINSISSARGNAVYDWFLANGVKEKQISLYCYGSDQPLFENSSMANRAKNRRITIYLIPTQKMYKMAKKNKLNKNK
ncbi:MAG: OmpA family protein [Bacteroidales bacterium]|nr:OmpA family protein [Bacteroidales bacterium]